MDKEVIKEIATIYEHGVLRPLESLDLVEPSVVYLQILESRAELSMAELHAAATRLLQEAGLVITATQPSAERHTPISQERRAELAHLFSVGRPLSEIIIEDREGR